MLNFTAKHFRTFAEVILWVNLIACTIICLILGIGIGYSAFDSKALGALLGIVAGLLIGLLTCVVYGGLLALFLNLCKDAKNINKWLQYMWEHKFNADANQKTPQSLYDADVHYFEAGDVFEGKGELDLDDL